MAVSDDDVLELLRCAEYVSSEAIAAKLGVSRNAVHKHVDNLRAQGHVIKGVPHKGMVLERSPDGDVGPTSPAPETPRERPAEKATGRASSLPCPPPFAGVDLELYTISKVLELMERLDGEERRRRVAAYVCARFL